MALTKWGFGTNPPAVAGWGTKPARGKGTTKASIFAGSSAGGGSASGRVALVCLLWATVHSALASKRAKDLARRVAGPRTRDGLYRLAYNAQSVILTAWATAWFLRQPDRELYRAKPPLSWLFRAGQVASLGVLLSGVRAIGILDFAGLRSLWGLIKGRDPRPETEAQGPDLAKNDATYRRSGAWQNAFAR